MSDQAISFGDNVRVRNSKVTMEKGLAGLKGSVYGETTPSVTGVEVIGELKSDYALNVHFDGLNESFWFTPELLEFLDHGAGAEITLKGVPKKWTRTATGEWKEENTSAPKKPWWK